MGADGFTYVQCEHAHPSAPLPTRSTEATDNPADGAAEGEGCPSVVLNVASVVTAAMDGTGAVDGAGGE